MTIEIRYFAGARAAAGTDTESINANTLADAQAVMIATHGPELQRVLLGCSFLVDGAARRD
ncbi:MAG: MoaD/ThiS family protein, partial [Actinobacteria bacterium]|nr:MoaD/ThiS family protein [Actinomycetota bacterium]